MSLAPGITVGLLHAGEMGAAVAAVLKGRGARVIGTTAGRGPATAARCRLAGVEVLASLNDVVRQARVVLSLVPPAAAESVADDYARRALLAPADAIFVDLNSISPELSRRLARRIERAGRAYVDGAINGLARNLTTSGTLLLSGPRAADVAALFEGPVRVRTLGERIGAASAMKMLLAGLSKGLCGLFAELALIARRHDMLGAFEQTAAEIYPGMTQVVQRMLPTYAVHAGRRATEMAELESTARAAGLEPPVLSAIRELHDVLAKAEFDSAAGDVAAFIEQLADQGLIAAPAAASKELQPGR